MGKETFKTGREPLILVDSVHGDLVVRPWPRLDVQAQGNYTQSTKGDTLTFTGEGDLVLKVPEEASLRIASVHGDAVLKSIRGTCELGQVQGDMVLSNMSTVTLDEVHGDLVVRNLAGPLHVRLVQGDAVFRAVDGALAVGVVQGDLTAAYINGALDAEEVTGDVNVSAVNGDVTIGSGRRDLNARELGGLLQAKDIAGDIRLRGGLRAGEHSLAAQGDIVVRWPSGMPLAVTILAAEVENHLPLQDIEESKEGFRGHISDGGAHLALSAAGKVVLKEAELVRSKWFEGADGMFEKDFFSELGALGAQIAAEVNQEMAGLAAEFEANIAPNLQKMGEQFAQKANEAADKARAMADEFAARERASAGRRAEQSSPPPAKEKAAAEPGNAEEQLRILKMVEKGVITPEEANLLLEALEGN